MQLNGFSYVKWVQDISSFIDSYSSILQPSIQPICILILLMLALTVVAASLTGTSSSTSEPSRILTEPSNSIPTLPGSMLTEDSLTGTSSSTDERCRAL